MFSASVVNTFFGSFVLKSIKRSVINNSFRRRRINRHSSFDSPCEKKYLDTPQALIYMVPDVSIIFKRTTPWRIFFQATLLIPIIGIIFILPSCLGRADKIKTI
jgi:hypothetical protein